MKRLFWKARPYLFVPKKQRKYGKNWHFKKDSIEKLVKKVSYTEVAYSTVETPLSWKKQFKRLIIYSPCKNSAKNAVEICFQKKTVSKYFLVCSVQKRWPRNRQKIDIETWAYRSVHQKRISRNFVSTTVKNSLQIKSIMEKLFNTLPFNSTAQNTTQTSLSKKYQFDFLVEVYRAKVPSKTLSKVRCRKKTALKCSSWSSCTKKLPETPSEIHIRHKTVCKVHGKTSNQKCCPKHSQKNRLKKRQYLHARQENIVHKSLPKHRYNLPQMR